MSKIWISVKRFTRQFNGNLLLLSILMELSFSDLSISLLTSVHIYPYIYSFRSFPYCLIGIKVRWKGEEARGWGHEYISSWSMLKRGSIKAAFLPPINTSRVNNIPARLQESSQNPRSAQHMSGPIMTSRNTQQLVQYALYNWCCRGCCVSTPKWPDSQEIELKKF